MKNYAQILIKKSLLILKYLNEVHKSMKMMFIGTRCYPIGSIKHISYLKLNRFDDIFAKNESYNITILNPECYKTPSDTMEFLNALRGERFIHQQYYSIILKNRYKCNFKYYHKDWGFDEAKIRVFHLLKKNLKIK